MEISEDTVKMNLDDSIKCKGCPKIFKKVTILKHLSRKNLLKKCRQSYSEEELNDMKAKSRKTKMKNSEEPKKKKSHSCKFCGKIFNVPGKVIE